METAVLNPSQLHLLRMFSYNKDEESFKSLKEALFNYYSQRMDEESDKWWKENNHPPLPQHQILIYYTGLFVFFSAKIVSLQSKMQQ